ncbi:ring-1,2-phenylacetyl-CoA epoxidase subunit PaaE [Nocardioides massiliensis]|uniref:Ring-1,2-phenylacetyl-CoA epoxidase subunit PaaE n=3 Tax=Nocardioides massiliensis TaxID=1325935 RepID=A0ABT9NQD0_9ACTN|nr:2Fe-2S iron-sulfur cluster-binding protein [Nocardioides massiliensis]MDP9822641.1 ring-1,2-phenylacetyl-CoA epoxidase subunit PaaE [Nocardioides massiliensis]
MSGFHRLQVADVTRLTADAVSIGLCVPPDLAEVFCHLPGQHVPVRVPAHLLLDGAAEERRTYSVCVAPSRSRARGELRIGVRRLAGGRLSTHLVEDLRPGDVLEVAAPTGRFVLAPTAAESGPAHVVGIVGGSGITPVLAIAEELLAADPTSRVTLLVVNRTAESVMFAEELADLKDAHPARVVLTHVLTREPQAAPVLSGRPDPQRWARLLDAALTGAPAVTGWYLCGPLALVDEARDAVRARGVPADRVHVELFHAGAPLAAPAVPGDEDAAAHIITARLGGRLTTVATQPYDASVLDAVLRARTDAPYACRGGVCGTCRAQVVSGEVAMADQWALEAAEVEAGYVLTCRSRATTAVLELDYDA